MSGKPFVTPWAVETNFPAGGNLWNGNPCKVAPAGDLWTPNTKPPAEQLNFVQNLAKVEVESVADWAPGPGQNWITKFTMPSTITSPLVGAVGYDEVNKQWMVAVSDATPTAFEVQIGGGLDSSDWAQLGGVTGGAAFPQSVCKDGSDATTYYLGALHAGGGLVNFYKLVNSGSPAWTSLGGSSASGIAECKVAYFNGHLLVFTGGSSAAATTLQWSTNQGSSFTSVTLTGSPTVDSWNVKSSATECLALPYGQAGAAPFLFRSTDGATWTKISITAGLFGSTSDVIVDAVSCPTATVPVWLLQVNSASGVYFLRSMDGGQTWSAGSAVHGLSAAGTTAVGRPCLASFGTHVVAMAVDSSSVMRSAFSPDAGVTWYRSRGVLGGGAVLFGMAQGADQALLFSNIATVRPSLVAGLPSSALT